MGWHDSLLTEYLKTRTNLALLVMPLLVALMCLSVEHARVFWAENPVFAQHLGGL